ncbi:rod shape-determining protein MreD [Paenibacillus sp. J2TS4]|uniref:rod shape-determining protein MreD n=1 Tax=Paenibacillus sp. J2TS4 TaxID=2807194 RepID=UPI001B2327E7|nr:rod shape-determining protein MreD [Paenibacillus sp. J2TS4]GIP31365.1 hypothetical protein J2TS4_05750 [Paenibacillus sp. J2TS4]
MGRNKLTLLLLLLFLLEGTVAKWIIPPSWQLQVVVTPHLTLVAIMFIGIYLNKRLGLAYGLGFGLLHDIVYYGPMIGTYCMTMGVIGYLSGYIPFRSQANIMTSLFLVVSGNLLFEWMIYGIYRVTQIRHMDPQWAFMNIMLPTILVNLLFALMIYVPMRKMLDHIRKIQKREKE